MKIYLSAALLAFLVAAAAAAIARRREKSTSERNAQLEVEVAQARAELVRVAPYTKVADAAAEATRIQTNAVEKREAMLREAQHRLAEIQGQAQARLDEARREAAELLANEEARVAELLSNARQKVREERQKAETVSLQAHEQAARIVENAEKRASEIAGDAYRAMQGAEQWKETARAMKNTVEGYGDAYLRSPYQLLDELADAYDHKEAGRELKLARERTNQMIDAGRASDCDYKERRRRTDAMAFVLDAFNGKVDQILSRIPKSNSGTLERQILDAYALVNHTGQAFKSARITQEYLNARLAELKWGASAYLLREIEREEQRNIKARIREEERARREFEKAQRDAQKDEAAVRKAMAKAEQKIAQANEAQRAKYEAQLADLQAKLREAEDRTQRAVSMAQLTRSGHVYVISNVGSFGDDVVKIGMTRRLEPLDRVRELGDASVPFKFDVHAMIYSEDAPTLESALHRRFALEQLNKVNPRKEFFRTKLSDIRACVEELGLSVHWTMRAEAVEYRESKALEQKLDSDPATREQWLRAQEDWEAFVASNGDPDEDSDTAPTNAGTERVAVVH